MFLPKKYILANELVQKMKIHIANISMLRKEFEANDDAYTIRKLNNCSFVNTLSHKLPKNIKDGIQEHDFTDTSDKLPCTWMRAEYEATERELVSSGLVIAKPKIAGKDFYQFEAEFVGTMNGRMGYVLNEEEYQKCLAEGSIEGGHQLKRGKYFVWYKIDG